MSIPARKKFIGLNSVKTEEFTESIKLENKTEIERLRTEIANLETNISSLSTTRNNLISKIKIKQKLENEVRNVLFNMHINNTKKVMKVIDIENKKEKLYDSTNKDLLQTDYLLKKKLVDLIVSTKTSLEV